MRDGPMKTGKEMKTVAGTKDNAVFGASRTNRVGIVAKQYTSPTVPRFFRRGFLL